MKIHYISYSMQSMKFRLLLASNPSESYSFKNVQLQHNSAALLEADYYRADPNEVLIVRTLYEACVLKLGTFCCKTEKTALKAAIDSANIFEVMCTEFEFWADS